MYSQLELNNNQIIRAVIFDLAGLMVDDEGLWGKAYKSVIEQYVGEIVDEHPNISGLAEPENWRWQMKHYRFYEKIDILIQKRKRALNDLLAKVGVKTLPGLYEIVDFFRKADLKMAVASSASRDYLDAVLRKINLHDAFITVISGEEIEYGKPNPDINLLCAQKMDIDVRPCLVFEDAPSGVKAAKRALMQVVVVPNKHTKNCDFSDADYILKSLLEVPTIFKAKDNNSA